MAAVYEFDKSAQTPGVLAPTTQLEAAKLEALTTSVMDKAGAGAAEALHDELHMLNGKDGSYITMLNDQITKDTVTVLSASRCINVSK